MADPVHLESCPFCGAAATVIPQKASRGPDAAIVSCAAACAVHPSISHIHRDEAVAAWNRRAAPDEARALREALEKIAHVVGETDPAIMWPWAQAEARAALSSTGDKSE